MGSRGYYSLLGGGGDLPSRFFTKTLTSEQARRVAVNSFFPWDDTTGHARARTIYEDLAGLADNLARGVVYVRGLAESIGAPTDAVFDANQSATTHLTAGGDGSSNTVYTTASITPHAHRLILCAVTGWANPTLATPTVTGCGVTWVAHSGAAVDFATIASATNRTTVFRAMGTPTTGTLTITFGSSQANCSWTVDEISHVDESGSNGANAIVQAATNRADGQGTALTATLGAFASAANGTWAAFAQDLNQAFTAKSGYANEGNGIAASGNSTGSEWLASNDTTPSATPQTSTNIAIVALEIKNVFTINYNRGISENVNAPTDSPDGVWATPPNHLLDGWVVGASVTSVTSASFTPAGSTLILLTIGTIGAAKPSSVTTTTGLNFVEIDTQSYSSGAAWLTTYRAMVASPVTGTITINWLANSTGNWIIDAYPGVDTTGADGSGAIVQSAKASVAAASSVSAALAAFGSAQNTTYASVRKRQITESQRIKAKAGWVQVGITHDTADGGGDSKMFTEYYRGNDTTPSATWTTSEDAAIIALEIKAAASGTVYNRSPADSLTAVTDAVARAFAGMRAIGDSAAATTDAVSRAMESARAVADAVAAPLDAVARAQHAARAVAEAVSAAADAVARAFAGSRAIGDAVAAASDTVARSTATARAIADSLGAPTDAVTRAGAVARAVADAVSAVSAAVARAVAAARGLAEPVAAPTDAPTHAADAFARSPAESVAAPSDLATRASALARAVAEAVAAPLDAAGRALAYLRGLADSTSAPVDAASGVKAANSYQRGTSETIGGPADSVSRATALGRGVAEAVALVVDLGSRAWTGARALAEAVPGPTDAIAYAQLLLRQLADTVAAPSDLASYEREAARRVIALAVTAARPIAISTSMRQALVLTHSVTRPVSVALSAAQGLLVDLATSRALTVTTTTEVLMPAIGQPLRVGASFRIHCRVTDEAGALADPDHLTVTVKQVTADAVTYVYGTDAELVRDGLGLFRIDVVAEEVGPCRYRAEADAGLNVDIDEGFQRAVGLEF